MSNSWAQSEIESVLSDASPIAKIVKAAKSAPDKTPEELKFSTGRLEETDSGVQLVLDVTNGVGTDIPGLLQAESRGDVTVLTLDENHGEGLVQARNSEGSYGKMQVRRLYITVDQLEQGPRHSTPEELAQGIIHNPNDPVFEDDIYKSLRRFLIILSIQEEDEQNREARENIKDVKDLILYSNSSVITHRANGDLDLQLYRRDENNHLEYIGHVLVDSQYRYEVERASGSAFIERLNNMRRELHSLELQIRQQSEQIVQMMVNGERTDLQQLMDDVDGLKFRGRELLQQLEVPTDFAFFAVSEKLDYSANHYVKWSGEGGLEVASQVVANQVLADLSASAVLKLQVEENTKRILREATYYLDLLAQKNGIGKDVSLEDYAARMLASAWAAFKGDKSRPTSDVIDTVPVLEINGNNYIVTHMESAADVVEALEEMIQGQFYGDFLVMLPQEQRKELIELMDNASNIEWLKGKFGQGHYEITELSERVQAILDKLGRRHVDEVFVSSRLSVKDDLSQEVTLEELGARHKKLIEEELEKQQKVSTVSGVSSALYDTASAAFIAGLTASTVQGVVDMGSKYYNEGKLPWDYTTKESEEMQKRAMVTATWGAAHGAIHNRAMAYMTSKRGDFTGLSAKVLENTGISAHRYTGAVAGAAASIGTSALSAGYSYYQGDIDGKQFIYKLVDSGARAVPTFAGGVVGHYLFPYSTGSLGLSNVPLLGGALSLVERALGPSLGSLGGSIGGSIAYDTAKHYLFSGMQAASDYYYGTGIESAATTTGASSEPVVTAEYLPEPVNDTVSVDFDAEASVAASGIEFSDVSSTPEEVVVSL
ncbi:hypothetical protein E1189_09985 [Sansalvadorimonas verongulae]|nr:hypothetical protein [Sansalvadorimonas verongulae]